MIKKSTGIWRYILVALIIVLSVSLIIGITSCENVDTDDYQETITDEPESQSQSEIDSGLNSESEQESESESEKETIQAKSVEGIITEVNKEKKDTYSSKVDSIEELKKLRSYINLYYDLGYNEKKYYNYYGQGKLNNKLKKEYSEQGIKLANEYFEEKGPVLKIIYRKKR